MQLTTNDYESLEHCYISRKWADAAGVWRCDSLEGREHVGRKNGAGDYAGLIFPYTDPVARQVVAERLRLDHPPLDSKGKPEHKYLSPYGQRNRFYWPLADPAWLEDPALPVVITEGEKKYLALHRASIEGGKNGRPLFLAIGIAGVWSWKGRIGYGCDANGKRVEIHGVIPDFDRVVWKPERRVLICFDANAQSNDKVRAARNQLSREIAARGGEAYHILIPATTAAGAPINGVDDLLGAAGLNLFLDLYHHALRWNWHDELIRSQNGKILPLFANALTALRLAPELHSLIAFNEFSKQHELRRESPWKTPAGPWTDRDDMLLREWLERKGVVQTKTNAADAAFTVAGDSPFHPVRDYLDSLKWDGVKRIDYWLTLYAGVEPDNEGYVSAAGAKWLIGGVARPFEPGSKVDTALILEGGQGVGKSRLLQILGGPFYSDDIAELGTKDAALGAAGVWIVELSELDAMTRAEVTRIKSFISRQIDRFRPPYGRHLIEAPRQCIFAGTINQARYLKDETGGRRFWPVVCGRALRLAELERDRDQLWAEAVTRYRAGEHWWLDTPELVEAAAEEQEERYQSDPWEPLVQGYLNPAVEVSIPEILAAPNGINKPAGQWQRADEQRIGAILKRLSWKYAGRPTRGGKRVRIYTYQP